jgi:hypothetical protein
VWYAAPAAIPQVAQNPTLTTRSLPRMTAGWSHQQTQVCPGHQETVHFLCAINQPAPKKGEKSTYQQQKTDMAKSQGQWNRTTVLAKLNHS